jgi:hypothetical protein
MPKYFSDERKLPFTKVEFRGPLITKPTLEEIFKTATTASICAAFTDFPKGCLGYVFNVRKHGTKFILSDIVGIETLSADNLDELAGIINHVTGSAFSERWQTIFQKRRNEIGLPAETADAEA